MSPEQQATKLVHDYYAIINGSPMSEVVNEEALSEAIERAKEEVRRTMNWVGSGNFKFCSILDSYTQVLNKLNEM
jgi:hypothetical protein